MRAAPPRAPAPTLPEMLRARIARDRAMPAARYWDGTAWRTDDWQTLGLRVMSLAAAFRDAGIGAGGRIGIFLPTCYAWTLTDYAAHVIGAVSVVYHADWQAAELGHAIGVLPPALVICGASQFDLLHAALAHGGHEAAVWLHATATDNDRLWQLTQAPAARPLVCEPPPDRTATVVFTSGTGGNAKAVALSAESLVAAAMQAYAQLGFDGRHCATLHWLPLSHLFGRIGPYLDLLAGGTGSFGRGPGALAADLRMTAPHVLFAVPTVLTRMRLRIEQSIDALPPPRRRVMHGLLRFGRLVAAAPVPLRLGLQRLLRAIVFGKLHRAIGGRLRLVVVGSAAVDPADKDFFEALGIAVREGYGMTETSGVAAVQPLRRPGCGAGRLLPGIEAKLGPDNELFLRGSLLLQRYLNAETFDPQGWFHTGDRCHIAPDGSVQVIGRIKDIIIPSSGENISPVRLEGLLQRDALVEDACIVGDGRPYLIALIAPSDAARERAASRGVAALAESIEHLLAAVNRQLPRYEHIRGYVLVPDGFSATAGELTVTQKKRRDMIQAARQPEIEACYARLRAKRLMHDAAPAS